MARINDIYYKDEVTLTHKEGTWKVNFVNFINGWIEVSNEDETVRVYPVNIATHTSHRRK